MLPAPVVPVGFAARAVLVESAVLVGFAARAESAVRIESDVRVEPAVPSVLVELVLLHFRIVFSVVDVVLVAVDSVLAVVDSVLAVLVALKRMLSQEPGMFPVFHFL